MKLLSTKKIKALLLSSALSLSVFLGGCSSLETVLNSNVTQQSEALNKSKSEIPEGSEEASVERVVDGDTMKLKLKNSNEVITLRLLLVDTPESVKPGVDPQAYAIEASNFAKEVLQVNDTVYIEYDSGSKTDRYGRHLGYLWYYSKENNSWQMFNKTIIEKGFARVGYIYSQKKHLDTLNEAQDKAKKNKLNIWSVDGYVTDKGFDVDAYNKNSWSSSSSNNNSENSSDRIVYANAGTSSSNKYHSSEHAHNMKGAIKMKESEAKSKGYVPCKICY